MRGPSRRERGGHQAHGRYQYACANEDRQVESNGELGRAVRSARQAFEELRQKRAERRADDRADKTEDANLLPVALEGTIGRVG